tara:strand:+ start:2388 stop:2507 length:120 start_codon:yes stop_codon:yes gene_type:complete
MSTLALRWYMTNFFVLDKEKNPSKIKKFAKTLKMFLLLK